MADTVEELKRYNARRKLKGAVQAIAGGTTLDPIFGADTDSSMTIFYINIRYTVIMLYIL